MTWKSTAVAGVATITATWLASYAPVGRAPAPRSVSPSVARTETAAAEIQREADRLRARLAQVGAYRDPARNPFQFGQRRVGRPAPLREPAIVVEDAIAPPSPEPPTLRVTLAGIAEDTVDGQPVRTAIVSTHNDVFVVKAGEELAGVYKVTAVDADAVELVRLDNGVVVRLALRP